MANLDSVRYASGSKPTSEIRLAMQKTMQTHAAVFRDSQSLTEGCQKLDKNFKEMDDLKVLTLTPSKNFFKYMNPIFIKKNEP